MTSSPSITPRPAATAGGRYHSPAEAGAATTRRLLACGAAAGPVFVAAIVVQALTRPGFSLTREAASAVSSWHGVAHQVCGSAAFLALVVACFILARRYRASWQRGMAACSLAAGVLCAAGVASGGAPHGSLTLFAGVSIALLWVAVVSARLSTAPKLAPAR